MTVEEVGSLGPEQLDLLRPNQREAENLDEQLNW